jgi:hypothetical protein
MAILSFDWSLQMYFLDKKIIFFASLVKALAKLFWLNWKLRGRQKISLTFSIEMMKFQGFCVRCPPTPI